MKKNAGGQTLIEILLAFSIAILVLSAIVVGTNTSLGNAQYTKNQNLASSYAQEGMEIVRKIRDSSWDKFLSYSGTYCLNEEKILVSDCADIGIFKREVIVGHRSENCLAPTPSVAPAVTPIINPTGSKVAVIVSWFDSKCPSGQNVRCHKVDLVSCFSNINQIPKP